MQLQLDARYNALEKFIREAMGANIPDEVKSELYRLATVRICGYIERCMEIIIIERITSRAHPKVINFVRSYFKYGRNLDTKATAELLNRFESSWYRSFTDFVDNTAGVKEGVNSCYGLRNGIAHGGTANVSDVRVLQLLTAAKAMIDGVVLATR